MELIPRTHPPVGCFFLVWEKVVPEQKQHESLFLYFFQPAVHAAFISRPPRGARVRTRLLRGLLDMAASGVKRSHHVPRPCPQRNPLPAGKNNCCWQVASPAEVPPAAWTWTQSVDSSPPGSGWGPAAPRRPRRRGTSGRPPRWCRPETFLCSGSRCNILCTPLPPQTAASSPSVQTSQIKKKEQIK